MRNCRIVTTSDRKAATLLMERQGEWEEAETMGKSIAHFVGCCYASKTMLSQEFPVMRTPRTALVQVPLCPWGIALCGMRSGSQD